MKFGFVSFANYWSCFLIAQKFKLNTLQKLLSHMSGPLSPGARAAASPHQLYSHIIAMSHNGTSFNKEPAAYTPFNV